MRLAAGTHRQQRNVSEFPRHRGRSKQAVVTCPAHLLHELAQLARHALHQAVRRDAQRQRLRAQHAAGGGRRRHGGAALGVLKEGEKSRRQQRVGGLQGRVQGRRGSQWADCGLAHRSILQGWCFRQGASQATRGGGKGRDARARKRRTHQSVGRRIACACCRCRRELLDGLLLRPH